MDIIHILMKINLFKSLKYNIPRKGAYFVLFYNRNIIKIDKTATITLGDANLCFFYSRYKEPFVGMLEMHRKAKIIANGNFIVHSGGHIIVSEGATLELGHNSYINRHCRIKVFQYLKIGNNCAISENVTIWDSDVHELLKSEKTKPVTIGNNVWIGTNTIILKGVTIGDGAVVAAGSLVNRDVPSRTLVGGIPAKVLKTNVDWVL